jgi:peptidoglycan/LPS O-acetylase OafA/YrhL
MPDRTAQGRIPELDGLRRTAIVLVLLYHYAYLAPPADPTSVLARLQRSCGMGWAGVDLFFVLSGFLIGGILLDARSSGSYFETFYARRFFRIIPLYYIWIGINFALTLTAFRVYLKPFGAVPEQWQSVPVYMSFLQNCTENLHSNLGTAWLSHLRSLAVEEQFYLLMPLAVRFLPRRRLVPLLLTSSVAAPIARILVFKLSATHAKQYMLAPCRADALAMGVLLAVCWRDERWKIQILSRKKLLFSAALLLLTGALYLAYLNPSPYSYAMTVWGFSSVDLFFTCLLTIILMCPQGFVGAAFRSTVLTELGRLSYCMHLIHLVVNLLCHALLLHDTPQIKSWQSAAVTVLAAVATYGIARLSWTYLENPLLRRGRQYKY